MTKNKINIKEATLNLDTPTSDNKIDYAESSSIRNESTVVQTKNSFQSSELVESKSDLSDMEINYKEIILSYEKNLNEKELYALKIFNQSFNKNEIQIENDANRIIILLREINLEKVKSFANQLSSSLEKPIFNDIINSIEKIKSYGIKGNKRNYVDYNKERKVKDRKAKEENRGQYYYAIDNNFLTINNILSENLLNKIICADSEEYLKTLPDNSIDLIFTSPPYNFGLSYDENMENPNISQKDYHFWEDYFNKLFKIFDECIRVTKFGGRIIINIQPLFSDYIPSHHIISNYFIRNKLIWKGEILWEKNNYNCKYTAWGSWKSPSNPYLKYTWEFIEIFCKGSLKKEGKTDNIDISAEEFKKWVVGKWSIAPERNMKKFNHPAMFPEELVERIIKLFSYKNDIILDPFNGVGTTSFIAKKFKRNFIGIDISEEYCRIANQRIQNLQDNQGFFDNE